MNSVLNTGRNEALAAAGGPSVQAAGMMDEQRPTVPPQVEAMARALSESGRADEALTMLRQHAMKGPPKLETVRLFNPKSPDKYHDVREGSKSHAALVNDGWGLAPREIDNTAEIEQRVALANEMDPGNATAMYYAKLADPAQFNAWMGKRDESGSLKRTQLTDDQERARGLDPRGVYEVDGHGRTSVLQSPPADRRVNYATLYHPKRPNEPVTVEEGSQKFASYLQGGYVKGQPRTENPGSLVNLKGPRGEIITRASDRG